jgi:hypothetical protein
MNRFRRFAAASMCSLLAAMSLKAQDAIPLRALPAPTAVSTDSLGYRVTVRPLSDGRVLVNDVRRFRVLLYDKTLTTHTLVLDSATSLGGSTFVVATLPLIAVPGDSTFYVDFGSRSLLLIDPNGKVARPVALPRPNDVGWFAYGHAGMPVLDSKGRLVYGSGFPYGAPTNAEVAEKLLRAASFDWVPRPDSGTIVRADFEARVVDTLTTRKVRSGEVRIRYSRENDGNVTRRTTINPFDAADEWALLPNGTIAIVRAHDYRIDWIDADGTKRSSTKMPVDWIRLTDEDKRRKVDARKLEYERLSAAQPRERLPSSFGPRWLTPVIELVGPAELPDYEPPISPGAVMVDLEGNLWIVPRTAIPNGTGGLRYDVVNQKGRIVERVTVPKGRRIVAFEPGGTVILANVQGSVTTIERAPLR